MDLAPDVSVIIAAYNAEATIERALLSAIDQVGVRTEIIVVDDRSTDNTRGVVKEFAAKHAGCLLIEAAENLGPGGARNLAISSARGRWIAVLDADDAWKPGRAAHLLGVASSNDLDFVADNQIFYDAVAKKEGRLGFNTKWKLSPIDPESFFLNDILEKVEFGYGALKPIIRKEFLSRSGVRYDTSVRFGEDFKFAAECLFHGARAMVSSEPFYIYTTRLGEFSRSLSPHSKTDSRFDLQLKISADLAVKYGAVITPSIATAMQKRSEQFQLIHLANIARQFRRQGRYLKYASFVLARPRLILLLARRQLSRF